MTAITVTAADVRPLPGAIVERHQAGGSGNVGDTVYMASDGDVEQADASAAGTTYAIGVVVSAPNGATAFVAGDEIDVAVLGRVTGFSGMTPNDVLYQSDTAARLDDAPGTTSHKVARARSATVVFINPPMTPCGIRRRWLKSGWQKDEPSTSWLVKFWLDCEC
jgi:hypothetical protein